MPFLSASPRRARFRAGAPSLLLEGDGASAVLSGRPQGVPVPMILPVNWTLRVAVAPDTAATVAVAGLKIRS